MSRPSFGGVAALRGGDHEHQHGRHHLRQEGHVVAPRAPAWVKVCTVIVSVKKYRVNLKNTAVLYPDYPYWPRTYFILELYFGN
jgi:hypothetical protein